MPYNNYMSKRKQKARDAVLKHCVKHIRSNRSINVFTLPAMSKFVFEKSLEEKFTNIKFDCVDDNEDIVRENNYIIEKAGLPYKMYHSDAIKFIKQSENKYDVIWLDFCNQLTVKTIEDLIELIQSSKLKNNSILSITLLKGREKQLKELYQTDNLHYIRTKGFIDTLKNAGKAVNKKVKLLDIGDYKGELKANSSPMFLYNFKIELA